MIQKVKEHQGNVAVLKINHFFVSFFHVLFLYLYLMYPLHINTHSQKAIFDHRYTCNNSKSSFPHNELQ